MTYSFDGYNYVIKLVKGERLSEAIEQFAQEAKIEGAWVEGLGGVLEVTLGYYELDKQDYRWQTFEGLRELVSFTGNLASNEEGKIMLHAHGVIADKDFQTLGGHIKDLVAGATIELFVHRSFRPLKRKKDSEVGLQTLDL
ncbi:MAG TPA: PPC domain-containing DNA-binding protein [Candidatus Saccharimonadales bacterium]|nr:PPC domain-containing DNA-binding protein [Candidatus Saccharimonadales bacterium]